MNEEVDKIPSRGNLKAVEIQSKIKYMRYTALQAVTTLYCAETLSLDTLRPNVTHVWSAHQSHDSSAT